MTVMSALSPKKRTSVSVISMSALGQQRTHALQQKQCSLDHLVGDREQRGRHDETKHPCGLRVNDKLEFCRLYHRQVGRSFTLGNPPGIDTGLAPSITVARQTRPYPRAGPRNQMAQTRPVTITIKAPNQRLGMRPTFAMPMR